jgi:hypothetical protein
MAIALAVGADNSRRRHHIFFIFALIAVGPKLWPCIRFGMSQIAYSQDRFCCFFSRPCTPFTL